MDYRYIVVEGSIGSGKSALSRRLAEYFDAMLLTEAPQRNPFLEPFYLNAANHGLATELHFLVRRVEALGVIQTEDERNQRVIADFLLEKDQIYVPVILRDDEQTLYWQLKQKVMPEFPVPDLVIYLEAGNDVLEKRLRQRNDGMLNVFPAGYLQQIHQEYRRFFHLYQHAPLLIANTDELDFIGNDDHFELLLRTMANMKGSRHYLNLSE
ncbi:deoxynucleoside kinase [Paralysiella testudinis]|uniref:Deoxynucleoside kinase n=1 Tax=Paralysiella testudinis TaxID=2809020 RepID=A0A892ZIB9_9NEIS|nr:deoxynucleoside kinase [Paralysiella testudinis]QRQ81587.1 deoxynucleoside kinase [Paralysiella testudinis]